MEILSRVVLTFILNATWQVALLAAVAAATARLLRRAPARYLHAVWVATLALSVLLPLSSLPACWETSATRLAEAVVVAKPPRETPSKPAPVLSAPLVTAAVSPGSSRSLPTALLRHHSRLISLPPLVAYVALGLYLLSLLCHVTRLTRAWRKTTRLHRTARLYDLPTGTAPLLAQCRTTMGLEKVSVLCSSETPGPVAMGFRRPVIILPQSLLETPATGDLAAALCHEMAHIRRRDYLVNLICEFLLLPVAFHPGAWLVKRRIDETRELACDEAAAQLAGASHYARSLVSLARALSAVTALSRPRYTLGVFDANILEERVMRLLERRSHLRARRAKLLLAGATLALAFAGVAASAFSFTAREGETVFVKTRGSIPSGFQGTWRGEFQGKTFLVVTLQKEGDSLGGTVNVGAFSIDQTGQVARVKAEPNAQNAVPIFDARWDGSLLSFRAKSGVPPTDLQFQMRLTGESAAELKGVAPPSPPGAPVGGWWKLSRQPEDSNVEISEGGPQSAVAGGVGGGVVGGVPGGVVGGVPGGVKDSVRVVKGGVVGGVPGGVGEGPMGGVVGGVPTQEEKKPSTLSGTVSDPSGARVPNAVVSLYGDSGLKRTVVTNDAGEFSFTDLPGGSFVIKVFHDGFEVPQKTIFKMPDGSAQYQGKTYALGPGAALPRLNIVLEPSSPTQSMVVTAKAPPEVIEKRHAVVPKRIRVGGEVEAAKLLTRVPPKYPESARTRGVEGTVLLEAVISSEGVPLSLRVLDSPDSELSDAALAAARQWHYKPTLLNGQPIEVVTTISINFRLED